MQWGVCAVIAQVQKTAKVMNASVQIERYVYALQSQRAWMESDGKLYSDSYTLRLKGLGQSRLDLDLSGQSLRPAGMSSSS